MNSVLASLIGSTEDPPPKDKIDINCKGPQMNMLQNIWVGRYRHNCDIAINKQLISPIEKGFL